VHKLAKPLLVPPQPRIRQSQGPLASVSSLRRNDTTSYNTRFKKDSKDAFASRFLRAFRHYGFRHRISTGPKMPALAMPMRLGPFSLMLAPMRILSVSSFVPATTAPASCVWSLLRISSRRLSGSYRPPISVDWISMHLRIYLCVCVRGCTCMHTDT